MMMKKKYTVSPEKFKRLYFYKFLFLQIWYGLSMLVLFATVYWLPGPITRALINSIAIYIFAPLLAASAILWMCSFPWYGDKIRNRRNSYVLREQNAVVFQKLYQRWQFYSRIPQYDTFTYTIQNIKNVQICKYNITVYGNVLMERAHVYSPKVILATKRFDKVKIPNVFDDKIFEFLRPE